MPYSTETLAHKAQSLLDNLGAVQKAAQDNHGVLEPTADDLGIEHSLFSRILDADETNTLRGVLDYYYSRKVGQLEKRLLDCAAGDIEVRPQGLTAIMAALNNKRQGWGTSRVEHSGSVGYGAVPLPQQSAAVDDVAPKLTLLKTGTDKGGPSGDGGGA